MPSKWSSRTLDLPATIEENFSYSGFYCTPDFGQKTTLVRRKRGWSCQISQATEFNVDLLKIEVARIKLTAEPVEHRPVFFVLGIFDSLQEFVVAPDAATVFRRTGVLSIQANRILFLRISRQGLLDHYFMCPAVAKIVFVNKGRLFVWCDVSQAKTPFVKPLLAGVVIV